MFKIFLLLFITTYVLSASTPTLEKYVEVESLQEKSLDVWGQHVQDFAQYLDFSAIFSVISKHIEDDEVKTVMTFMFSEEFHTLVFEFESLKEFHEIVLFLSKKGYDIVPLINAINPFLNIPPYSLPRRNTRQTGGVADFVVELISALPMKQWMELFETKMQNDPEFKEFILITSSPEFLAITDRLSANPKFQDIKQAFHNIGINSKLLCEIMNSLIGNTTPCK